MNEHLRGTGRTHRMVEKAYCLVRDGFSVFIMMYQRADIRSVEHIMESIVKARKEVDESLINERFMVRTIMDDPGFDWVEMRLRGYNRNVIFLVDHFAIEQKINRIDNDIKDLIDKRTKLYALTV